jgi:hypothetical protein
MSDGPYRSEVTLEIHSTEVLTEDLNMFLPNQLIKASHTMPAELCACQKAIFRKNDFHCQCVPYFTSSGFM